MQRKIKDTYELDEMIALLEKCYEEDIEFNFPKALLSLSYYIREILNEVD